MSRIWSPSETQKLVYYGHYLRLANDEMAFCFEGKTSRQIETKILDTKGYIEPAESLSPSDKIDIVREVREERKITDETIQRLSLKTIQQIGEEFRAKSGKPYRWSPEKEKELEDLIVQTYPASSNINWNDVSDVMGLPRRVVKAKWDDLRPKREILAWSSGLKTRFLSLLNQRNPSVTLSEIAEEMGISLVYCKKAKIVLASKVPPISTAEVAGAAAGVPGAAAGVVTPQAELTVEIGFRDQDRRLLRGSDVSDVEEGLRGLEDDDSESEEGPLEAVTIELSDQRAKTERQLTSNTASRVFKAAGVSSEIQAGSISDSEGATSQFESHQEFLEKVLEGRKKI